MRPEYVRIAEEDYVTSGDCPAATPSKLLSNNSEARHENKKEPFDEQRHTQSGRQNHGIVCHRRSMLEARKFTDEGQDLSALVCMPSVKERSDEQTFLHLRSSFPRGSVSADHLTGAKSNAFSHSATLSTYPQGASSTPTCVLALLLAAPNLRTPLT